MATVGYGDYFPTTIEGRLIGMVVMLVGIAFVSIVTAAVAARFARTPRAMEVLLTLPRIEADVGELKARIPAS